MLQVLKLREVRVSGESEDEYVKGARPGGTATGTTASTAAAATTETDPESTSRIQQLEQLLQQTQDDCAQVKRKAVFE